MQRRIERSRRYQHHHTGPSMMTSFIPINVRLKHLVHNTTRKGIESNAPNWETLKNHLYKEGRLSKEHC